MKLYIVGTSIGNIDDISPRAIKVLSEADVILAEDTRVFGKLKSILLDRYKDLNFNPLQKVISYREQNHDRVIDSIIKYLESNKMVVQISDSGMPGISDPGFLLYKRVINEGFELDVIPGPSSVITGLVASGLPTDRFVFLGFLPRKKSKAKNLLEIAFKTNFTLICFESPFRIRKLLELVEEIDKNTQIALCKELTKKHQKIYRGTAVSLLNELPSKISGEFVVVMKKTTVDQL
ncbi:MAG: ribosomal RNA small subunit methyltransferase I [Candidatus Dojkabacteria bacterium]|nr:MAG: ribosomal RNA small subunit methyltransferase I [Candidatus Dojkabacteria bacterium]